MPRPLIIYPQHHSSKFPVKSFSSGNENYNNNHDNNDLSDHQQDVKTKRVSREKKIKRRENGKSTVYRSKSLAELSKNSSSKNPKIYQRRHSNVSAQNTEKHMFDFTETFSKFESLSNISQNEENFIKVVKTKPVQHSHHEKESLDLIEIDQIKTKARILVQEARKIEQSRGKRQYLEWQNEVVELLKKIADIDHRKSETIQKEKAKTLKNLNQTYNQNENGFQSKTVQEPSVKVSALRNIYETQSHSAPEHNELGQHDYPNNRRSFSLSVSSVSSEEFEQIYLESIKPSDEDVEIHERIGFVEESHIAKVRDLKELFEKEDNQTSTMQISANIPALLNRPENELYRAEFVGSTQTENGKIYKVGDDGIIVGVHKVDVEAPRPLEAENVPPEEATVQVPVKELLHVFEGNEEKVQDEIENVPEDASDELTDRVGEQTEENQCHKVKELVSNFEDKDKVEYKIIVEEKYNKQYPVEETVEIEEIETVQNCEEENNGECDVVIEPVIVKPGDEGEDQLVFEGDNVKYEVAVKASEDSDDSEKKIMGRKVLEDIYEDVGRYEKEINDLDVKNDEKREFLNEMLLRCVIQLENFQTYEDEELLRGRKEALVLVKSCIEKLKEKYHELEVD